MKDYIYPLHNVTLDIALGEERSARLYSPDVQQALFFFNGVVKIKPSFCGQLVRIGTKHAWSWSSGNKPLSKYGRHTRRCGSRSVKGAQVTPSTEDGEQYKDLSRPI